MTIEFQPILIDHVRRRVLADDNPNESPPTCAGSANAPPPCSRRALGDYAAKPANQ
jgi:hypothetical protein